MCKVLAQNCNRKLTGDQTTAMIRATAKPARERREEILEKVSIKRLLYNNYDNHYYSLPITYY